MRKAKAVSISSFVLAFLIAFSIGSFITYQSNLVKFQNHERYMLNMLHSVTRDIEKRLERSLDAALFLKNEIELHGPDDLVASFENYAESLINKIDGITNLQLAPDGVIQQIYPLAGHEAALGYRFMADDPRSSVAWNAYLKNELIILGPFELVQGGMGIVASAPVFHTPENKRKPWGFVTVLMLMDDFIKSTGLPELVARELDYEITVTDEITKQAFTFSSETYPAQNVTHHQKSIQIQNSVWELKLHDKTPYNSLGWIGYIISLFSATLFAFATLWLVRQPEKLRRIVEERTNEINRQKNFQGDLLNLIPMSIVVTNSDGRIVFKNKKFLSTGLLDTSKQEIEYITETSNEVFNNNARQLLERKKTLSESLLDLSKKHFIELTLLAIDTSDEHDNEYFVWAIRDVSALQEVNQALHELSSIRANIFELIPDGLAYFDNEGTIRSFNTQFLHQISALTQGGMVSCCREIESRLHHTAIVDGPKVNYTDIHDNLFDDTNNWTVSQVIHSLTEKNKLFSKVVKFDMGAAAGGLILLRDITDQVQMEQIKSEFLSTAAHELRTPMANVFGYLELMIDNKIPQDQQHGALKIVYEEAERLSHILDDLLDLARIESRLATSLNYQENSLKELLQQIIGKQSEYAKSHSLEVHIDDDLKPIMCDSEKIKQVMHNLISNAAKYSNPGSQIVFSAKEEQRNMIDGVLFSVTDHGIGMKEEQIERVFERFYRADQNSDRPGTGLGMAIVKQVIDLHCGEITVQSIYGEGTVVSVWLPLDRRNDS